MLTGRLVTEETSTKASHKVAARPESSQALVELLALARKAEKTTARIDFDQDRPADPLAGIINRPILRSLLAAMQYRHPMIVTHGRRTARLAVALASQLGWDRPELTYLELAALLHDLGKVGVPDNILAKPGELAADEAELLTIHLGIALDVLAALRVHSNVLNIIAHAYPHADLTTDGVSHAGKRHMGGRILAVADAYDSLRTDQPYRSAFSHEDALEQLQQAKDGRFDVNVTAALARLAQSTSVNGNPLDPHPADCEVPPLQPNDVQEASALCQIFSYMYILESLYDGFTLVDGDLRFVLSSRGANRLLGRAAGELQGKSWANCVLPATDSDGKELQDYEQPLNRVLASNKPVSRSLRMQGTSGRWTEIELQAVPLLADGNRLLGIAEIYRSQKRSSAPAEVRELKLAASRDPLTGVANRTELESQLAKLMAQFKSSGGSFAVLFLDADFFKRINDNYGHAIGDEVLIGMAKLLRQECYSGELIARYGGEEFVVVCPETDLASARRRAERLRLAISQSILCADPDVKVTASFGAAVVEKGDTIDTLLRRADKGLYRAKQSGRNRTCTLTAADLAIPDSNTIDTLESKDPFTYVAAFKALLASDMAVFKLGGFVREEEAVLTDVSPGRAVLRMGSTNFLGGWGTTSARRPVQVTLDFSEDVSRTGASNPITVQVTIQPIGRIRNSDIFRARANDVVALLRSYFAASDA